MTCAGTLGKVALVPDKFEEGIFNSVLMRFRCNKELIRPKYLKLILESIDVQNALIKDCIGVGIKNMVPTKEIKKIRVSVPSLTEQDKIIGKVEDKEKEMKELKKKLEEIGTQKNNILNHPK